MLYIATTVAASIFSTIASVSFKGLYGTLETEGGVVPIVSLRCMEDMGMLAQSSDGSVSCQADYESDVNTYFEITDLNTVFVQRGSGPAQEISLSDTVYNGTW